MPSQDLQPRDLFEKAIQNWRYIFLFIVFGGLLGYGLSFLQAPRYEAAAQISVSIDYARHPEIEDYEEDRAINEAGLLMVSDMVFDAVRTAAGREDISLSDAEMSGAFFAERIDDTWSLRVVGDDPNRTARVANLWAEEAFAQLDAAFTAAQEADALSGYIFALENCQDADSDTSDDYALCREGDPDAVENALREALSERDALLGQSRGLFPHARYTLVNFADVPAEATLHARGVFVFSGALLGLVLAMVYIFYLLSRKPAKEA